MKFIRRASIPACLLVCLFLVFCAYSNLFHKSAIESEQEENLELTTVFRYENGMAIRRGSVRIRCRQTEQSAALNDCGEASSFQVPKDNEATLILAGSDGREISRIALHFTAAAVTDASTDENGVGHISVKAEAEHLTLLLTLDESDRLRCGLYLNDLQ